MAFVDIRMPYGIDGLETARQILSIDPDMEIIILTGYSDTPRQSMARQLGVSNFQLLKKPFDPDELMQMAQFLAHRHDMHQRRGEQSK
jgi:DNA-binding NtrC family response regulator